MYYVDVLTCFLVETYLWHFFIFFCWKKRQRHIKAREISWVAFKYTSYCWWKKSGKPFDLVNIPLFTRFHTCWVVVWDFWTINSSGFKVTVQCDADAYGHVANFEGLCFSCVFVKMKHFCFNMGLNMIPESCHVKTCLMPGMQNRRPERRKHLDISGVHAYQPAPKKKKKNIYIYV